MFKQILNTKELLEKKNARLAELYQTAHRFVDNVSHEFRTPLTVIKEFTMLVCDGVVGPISDEQRHMLDVVVDRCDDLNTMVDDMLDISDWKRDCWAFFADRRTLRRSWKTCGRAIARRPCGA